MEVIKNLLSSQSFLGAIFSTIFIIGLGYYLRKKNKVSDQTAKGLTAVLMTVSLPALAFKSFMTDNKGQGLDAVKVLVFGFVAYLILIGLSFLFKFKYKGDKLKVVRNLTIFGSTTFFGIPIISGFSSQFPNGVLYANLFNIAYRVFLYSYCYIALSGMKFEKKNLKQILLNPIIIATFVGLLIWVTQGISPKTTIGENTYSIFRLDKTAPWFMQGVGYLAALASPLAWLAIGMTLAKISLKDASRDKDVWIYVAIKQVIVPAIFLGIVLALRAVNLLPTDASVAFSIIIMLATPPATVAVGYAISFDKEPVFASNASLVSTVVSVFALIVWIFILNLV
ncbi:AEC family transporter [Haploplasma axanthum]|uniref:Auxin efflux carrier n=1 Tax=Haploplasma axanthum TaxID=29552 RepID=A0A449BC87_HAPAX|nr:AEC family transporter [Haploplasma axanthum]VEU80042.1 auxin efflux carrier [Haploplasma axanthum]